jgi:AhpD family alkylhydroperoxidase
MIAMHKNWPEMAVQLTGAIKEVRLGSPEVTKAFSTMARAATEAGTLDTKTKELIALAISVAIRCDGCVAFHSQAAVKQGATREEIMEVMGMALYMGAGPSLMYAAQAVEAFDQFAAQAGATPANA